MGITFMFGIYLRPLKAVLAHFGLFFGKKGVFLDCYCLKKKKRKNLFVIKL